MFSLILTKNLRELFPTPHVFPDVDGDRVGFAAGNVLGLHLDSGHVRFGVEP